MSRLSTYRRLKKEHPEEVRQAALNRVAKTRVFRLLPDRAYLKLLYRIAEGKRLHLRHPMRYDEKLQWLKLYDRRPEYGVFADKYRVREVIAEKIGEQYLAKLYGVYRSFDEIDFDALPDRFVLKCTHDSGSIVICKDKSSFDKAAAAQKLTNALSTNMYDLFREWPYQAIEPRIVAEEYLEDAATGELRDYKFFCFDGEPKLLLIASGRQKKDQPTTFDLFDENGKHLPIELRHPNAEITPALPENFDEMRRLAKTLSDGFPHLRVDFYEVNGKVVFGELTFFSAGGFQPFTPDEWNTTVGGWITLPEKKRRK